jgi:ABC-type sugar transport system ATPase subunit
MAQVILKNITKVFDGAVVAVKQASLEIADKKLMVKNLSSPKPYLSHF